MQNSYKYHKLIDSQIPECLLTIDSPPKQLFCVGVPLNNLLSKPTVSIVGSRKPTAYGRAVTEQLIRELVQKGVVVVSGLALGIDSIAHKACIEGGGQTIAILPCGPDNIYPRSHTNLASQILKGGGALITEYPPGTLPLKQNFVARNRIVSAMGDIVLVTEAAEKSGTLHTANFALNQGKTVMAIPGPINSALSKGTNNLIKSGAIPVTEAGDLLQILGLNSSGLNQHINANTPEEYVVLTLIKQGVVDGHELLEQSKLETAIFNQTLTMLEINGQISPLGNNTWSLR